MVQRHDPRGTTLPKRLVVMKPERMFRARVLDHFLQLVKEVSVTDVSLLEVAGASFFTQGFLKLHSGGYM